MRGSEHVLRVESRGQLQLTIPTPTTHYVDQFLRLDCREALTANRVFPNAKELTESFAAANAAIHDVGLDPRSADVTAIVVGDGATPRTAATLALRTRWRVVSVDPALRTDLVAAWPHSIARLELRATGIEALPDRLDGACVVVAVHAHVALSVALKAVSRAGAHVVAAVAIPCCGWVHEAEGLRETVDRVDWGIWSPERRVLGWSS